MTLSQGNEPDIDMDLKSRQHIPFLILTILWSLAIYAVSHSPAMEVLIVGVGMLLLGIPICLAGICISDLRKSHWIKTHLRSGGILYALLDGRKLLIVLFWTVCGLVISFVMQLQIHIMLALVEWEVLVVAMLLFTILFAFTYHLFLNKLKKELRANLVVIYALTWTCRVLPLILLMLYVVAMMWWGDIPQYTSIEAAKAANMSEAADLSGSAVVREGLHWIGFFDGLRGYVLGYLASRETLLAGLMVLFANYVLLYFACLALSCFLIPRAAYERASLVPRSPKDKFKVAAFASFLILFIYFPLLAQLEAYVSQSPEFAQTRTNVEATITAVVQRAEPYVSQSLDSAQTRASVEATKTVVVQRAEPYVSQSLDSAQIRASVEATKTVVVQRTEQIGGMYYREGTLDQIAQAGIEPLLQVGEAAELLRLEVDSMFEKLETEAVEEYLDRYYSLTAEWVRLLKLLTGGMDNFENYLVEKMEETFEQKEFYEGIKLASERFISADEEAQKAYEKTVRDILDHNQISLNRLQPMEVLESVASFENIFQSSFHQGFIPSAYRFTSGGVSGGAVGAVGYIIAKKIKTKILAKLILKVAAKAPLKALSSKVMSSATGAAVGATVGSAVPVLGTAFGAVVGIGVGIGTGIAIDGGLLKVEEVLSRDKFRQELVEVIREARFEFEEQYLGISNSPKPAEQLPPTPISEIRT